MDAILVCNLHAIQNKYLFVRKKNFSPVFVIFVSKILVDIDIDIDIDILFPESV